MGLEERGVEANCVCIASACLHLFAWGAPAVACLALLDLYFFQQSQRRLNRFTVRDHCMYGYRCPKSICLYMTYVIDQ